MHFKVYITAILVIILSYTSCYAEGKTFAILGKSEDDINFSAVAAGCADVALKNGDNCINISPPGPAHPRNQIEALQDAIRKQNISGIAISVVHSKSLSKAVQKLPKRISVISFDSPFYTNDLTQEMPYIGPDNVILGKRLGEIATQLHPQGGTVCIMCDMHDPNIRQRIQGVRMILSDNNKFPLSKHLRGENNWTESKFSPLKVEDNIDRTLILLKKILNEVKPDVFISVGHWPLLNPEHYRSIIAPHREEIKQGKLSILCATGSILPWMKKLVEENYLSAIVSFDFFHIGELCYQQMRLLNEGKVLPMRTIVPTVDLIMNYNSTIHKSSAN